MAHPIEGLLLRLVGPYLQVIDVNLHNLLPNYTTQWPYPVFSDQNFIGGADGSRIVENFYKIPIRIPKEFLEQTTLALVCENTGTDFSRHNFWSVVVGTTTTSGDGGTMMQLRLGYTSCRAQPTSVSCVASPPPSPYPRLAAPPPPHGL